MSEELKDIKIEEIVPEMEEAVKENKIFTKFQKMADKLLSKVNGRINAERDSVRSKIQSANDTTQNTLDSFISSTNKGLESFKKRYEAMYSDLVRRILVKQEERVFTAELFEQATLDLFVEMMFDREHGDFPDAKVREARLKEYILVCAERHRELMQKHHDVYANNQKIESDAESVEENAPKEESKN